MLKEKEIKEINEDPEKYIATKCKDTEKLKKLVETAAYAYHNSVGCGLSDNSYDALEYELKKREKRQGRLYDKIGAPMVDKLKCVLPYPLPSLSKVKPGTQECTSFLSKYSEIVWMSKLDGVSCMAVYEKGLLKSLYTRGDGIEGGNVSYLIDHINIPRELENKYQSPLATSVRQKVVVRGELIITKKTWLNNTSKTYSNARACVSGKTNAGHLSPNLDEIDFVAYEIIDIKTKENIKPLKPSKALQWLENEGFEVVEYGVIDNPTVFEIIQLYKDKRSTSTYYMDGLVLKDNHATPYVLSTALAISPTNAVAFKMLLEEQIRHTTVENIVWHITRHGRFFPVVHFKPIYIDGTRLRRATGHNAEHIIKKWCMGKGTKIDVVKSGDIIPQVKNVIVDTNIKPIYPDNTYAWHFKGVDIVLDEIEGNKEVFIKRLLHFFRTIKLKGFGPAAAIKFYEFGFTTPEMVVKAKEKDLLKIKGVGVKSAKNYCENIKIGLHSIPPDRLMNASMSSDKGIGTKVLKQLFRSIPNILSMDAKEIEKYFKSHKVAGFGPVRIKQVMIQIPKFVDYLQDFMNEKDLIVLKGYYSNKLEKLNKEGRNEMIKNKKFVLTGFQMEDPDELTDYIYDHQGEVSVKVDKTTTVLICGSVTEITSKMNEAYRLKIPVLTIQEFKDRYECDFDDVENEEEI